MCVWRQYEWSNALLEWCNGPLEWSNSPLEWSNGPLEWCNGPLEWCNGPLEWYNSLLEWHFGARYQNDTQVRCYSNSYIVHCEEGSHIHSTAWWTCSVQISIWFFNTKMKNLQLLKIWKKKWKWPETVERMRIHSNALIRGEVMILLLSIYLRFLEVNIPAH